MGFHQKYWWKVEQISMPFAHVLTITVRQAAVAAQRTMTFQYGKPLERHSYRQVLKSF